MSITPNSPIQFTNRYNQSDQYNYWPYGMAIVDCGLVQIGQVNGIGLLTRGLVWQAPEVWFDPQSVLGLSTGWSAAAGYSGSATLYTTGWTAAAGYSGSATLIATAWMLSKSFADEGIF